MKQEEQEKQEKQAIRAARSQSAWKLARTAEWSDPA